MRGKKYLILGSSIALGVYVPALKLKKQIEKQGNQAVIFCLEELYVDKSEVIERTKKSFHEDFRLAKASYRIPTRNTSVVSSELKARFIRSLSQIQYDSIITISGFWTEILTELIEACPYYEGRLFALHMDAEYSLSWKNANREGFKEIWLFNLPENRICYSLEPVRISETQDNGRILVHGGGWGIGEYDKKIKQLNELGFNLDIIVYYKEEVKPNDLINNYYLLDPEWQQGENKSEFPRILKYEFGEWTELCDCADRINPLSILIKQADAILSKPGGGTLVDSLDTATPLIFSEELAYYEKANMELWIKQGFGIKFEDFVRAASPELALEEMKKHLIASCSELSSVLSIL